MVVALASLASASLVVAPAMPAGAAASAEVRPAAAGPTVTAAELLPPEGSPPGTLVVPFDLNDEGQVVGASYRGSLDTVESRPILWEQGRARQLPAPDERDSYRAEHINDRGEVLVETSFSGAYRWVDGQVTDLRGTDDESVTTVGLNERGEALITRSTDGSLLPERHGVWDDGAFTRLVAEGEWPATRVSSIELSDGGLVVGTFVASWQVVPTPSRAFAWRDGALRMLSDEAWSSAAVGVNRHGQVVGEQPSDGDGGTLWDADGRAVRLPIRPTDINDRGQVVGTLERGDGDRVAALWDDGRVTVLGTLGGASRPTSINERGQVIGVSETADGEDHHFLWADGHLLDLGPRAEPLRRPELPFELNDEGQAIGMMATPDGPRARLWTIEGGSGDPGEGGCVTATNAEHVAAGRATSVLAFAWAVGSDQYLGLTSRPTALRQTAPGRWELVDGC